MSETRKNHLSIDGGQVTEDEHVASYKPIPESETEFRTSKTSLSKSKEKVSVDGAEEKLLAKEEEAKIVTRVDMADAKYVVGDHRNGDAKIELDANKRQFAGLTKDELLKYADDPFWVNLRWFMFILFWAMWFGMLAGAVVIIVKAPKCAPPTPRTWFEKGPLVDAGDWSPAELEAKLPLLKSSMVQGVFIDAPTYEMVDDPHAMDQLKAFLNKAKEYSVKVIVNLTPNFVSSEHSWFQMSVNRTGEYANYFIWKPITEYDSKGIAENPNSWVSTLSTSAWTLHGTRNDFYLHQYAENQPDLNFNNPLVVAEFDKVIKAYMQAGAAGIRLYKARQLLVNTTFLNDPANFGRGSVPASDHMDYSFWRHKYTSDQPQLDSLFAHWSTLVDDSSSSPGTGETVFTIAEEGDRPELFLLERNMTALRPPMTKPLRITQNVTAVFQEINSRLGRWPALQLVGSPGSEQELAIFSMLLPASPVLTFQQLREDNSSEVVSEQVSHVASLREDASVQHGQYALLVAPDVTSTSASGSLLACARWKSGHTGYVAVFNPAQEEARANLTSVPSLPATVTLHHVSHDVKLYTNYTNNYLERSDNVLVPPLSTVVLSYVPVTAVEN